MLIYIIIITLVKSTNYQCGHPVLDPYTDPDHYNSLQFETLSSHHSTNGNTNIPGYRIYLTEAANKNGALCLDGSTPVIYFRRGYSSGINKFQISFQAGGWCSGVGNDSFDYVPSMDNCAYRSSIFLGTTKNDRPYMNLNGYYGYMSDNYTVNPLSYNWNTAFVRYCSGDSFMGNAYEPYKYNSTLTLYYRGFRILQGVFEYLTTEFALNQATDVLISGGSSGALATWFHSNYIKQTYINPKANMMSMPDSGFFLQFEGVGEYIKGWKWKYDNQNLSAILKLEQSECIAENDGDNELNCVFAQNVAKYLKVKLFALQSRYDSWQLNNELCNTNNDTIVNGYGYNLTVNFLNNFINNKKINSGGYFDSCYHHTFYWNGIHIDNYTESLAQVDFYYDNLTHSRLWFQNESYYCGNCCK